MRRDRGVVKHHIEAFVLERGVSAAALIAAAIAAVFGLCSCVETTTTGPDGTVTKKKEADQGVLRFAGDVVRAYSPREIERGGK